jgi:hypothetical protein
MYVADFIGRLLAWKSLRPVVEYHVPDTGPCLQLRAHLPETLKYSDWVLMFSTETDGVSLTNLYRQVKDAGPLLIFVKDEAGYVCGDDDTVMSFFLHSEAGPWACASPLW